MHFKKFSFFFLAVFACSACAPETAFEKADIFFTETGNGASDVKLTVELAVTQEQQAYGFMGRKTIPEGTGMIFIYKKDTKLSFWMKNTPSALSIAFIGSTGIVKEIYDMQPFSSEPVKSTFSVRYALEVPQGMFAKFGIQKGSRLTAESLRLLKKY